MEDNIKMLQSSRLFRVRCARLQGAVVWAT